MAEPSFLAAVRESYDTVAADYVERVPPPAVMDPLSRAMLAGFAELVRTAGLGPVADLGCGPGRVTAHLAGLGVSAFGVDLSPKMIGLARHAYPNLRFTAGSMTALEMRGDELGSILAWYSRLEQEPGGRVNRPHACLLARKPEKP
ncbi:class I SAM-dependent methyltransferase [Streptomyces sp. NBC_00878]|uniref:class I SAM-dependent methyltransferase n=1 Tax=Streptomyces sp. NBC_00878 TaxID=2975854 RepID=UPI0022581BC3|nr:class I SAM-dependent methyltransferase [Streptomyces sp. NBC_00878]MCX4906310.1 class I SAM-dependent methyltransferase [Streptomyces sp. NBC_00878]